MNLAEMRMRELAASVESYRILLALKQNELELAYAQIIRIGQELGGIAFEELSRAGQSNPPDVEALATIILTAVRSRLSAGGGSPLQRPPEQINPRGQPEDIISLSNFGAFACTRLAEKDPGTQTSETAMKSGCSRAHAGLTGVVADLFQGMGFEVDREPARVKIDEHRSYLPDLIISREGRSCYVEVETGERDDPVLLSSKWENASIAGAGAIYVVASRHSVMNAISGSITAWAAGSGKKIALHLTYLGDLRRVPPGGNPWTRIREKGRISGAPPA